MTNSILEGLSNSNGISEEVRHRLEGEAKFVRAFTYFYLVNIYGDVPLILTTDYRKNSLAARNNEEEIYEVIVNNLYEAMDLLKETYSTGERTQVTRYTAIALLARVQLYLENWEQAEILSSQIINAENTFEIQENLDSVFLANSREAIWQLSPQGRGNNQTHTNEGANFIIHPFLSFLANLKLNDNFKDIFAEEDKRLHSWIKFHPGTNSFFSFKYKIDNSTANITEYSMVLRLPEQYLIRAEALTNMENLPGAIQNLDKIRNRAGLPLISDTNPTVTKEELLDLILEERKKELFAEWGHRWLDLKRTGRAGDVIGVANTFWQETDVLYPIPETELMKNPNLTQNDGY